jgi:hypothetical protein
VLRCVGVAGALLDLWHQEKKHGNIVLIEQSDPEWRDLWPDLF